VSLVTEHVPSGRFVPNLDKPHGPDTRLPDGSGVMLDEAPFSRPCEEVVMIPLADGTRLRTVLMTGSRSHVTRDEPAPAARSEPAR
jgi:hypothetical protein